MRRLQKMALALSFCLLATTATAAEFPLRAEYPNVKPISLEDLAAQYDQAVIVDVRSQMEFDTIHIAKAKHIQVTKSDFIDKLVEARDKNGSQPLAFYCNGHTCAKSYKAAVAAMEAGFANVYCFDAGIFEWVDAYPERGSLLGQTPADKSKMIPKNLLDEHKIDFATFKSKAGESNSIVIDARDPFQRAKDASLPQNRAVNLDNVRSIPMDRLVKLVGKQQFADQQVLIFDAVGKQVRWLQYYLEDAGYRNYYFLDNGVLSAAEAGATL